MIGRENMKKTILTSIIAMSMACPTYAYIAKNNNDPSCDQSTIGATTGTTNLEAEWDPNTINMEWYSNGSKITPANNAANTCTYDANVTLPTNTLSKTGYTFLGWKVLGPQCFANVDMSISGSDDFEYISTDNTNNYNAHKYGVTERSEWAMAFSYGTVKGISKCSAKSANHHNTQWGGDVSDWTATETEITNASGETRYCWCKATTYTPTNGNACQIAFENWVYNGDHGIASDCARICTYDCADGLRDDNAAWRRALFYFAH